MTVPIFIVLYTIPLLFLWILVFFGDENKDDSFLIVISIIPFINTLFVALAIIVYIFTAIREYILNRIHVKKWYYQHD